MWGIQYNLTTKIGVSLFPHVLCKQKSHHAEILSRQAHHLFFTFEIQRMKENMFPWISGFKNLKYLELIMYSDPTVLYTQFQFPRHTIQISKLLQKC